jgi:hypothetical protein
LTKVLDIGRDVQRLDISDAADPMPIAPAEKIANRPVVRDAGVLVADRGGEDSRNRRAAWSPASAMTRGTTMPSRVATARVRDGGMATCWLMPFGVT